MAIFNQDSNPSEESGLGVPSPVPTTIIKVMGLGGGGGALLSWRLDGPRVFGIRKP